MPIPQSDLRLGSDGQPLDGRRIEAAQTRVLRETHGNVEPQSMAEPNAYRVFSGYVAGAQTVTAPAAFAVRRPMRQTAFAAQGIGAALNGTDYVQVTMVVYRGGVVVPESTAILQVKAQNTLYEDTAGHSLRPGDVLVVVSETANTPAADVWWHVYAKEEVR